MPPPFPIKRMLGIDFFMGTPAEAVAFISKHGGLVIAPAAPSFIALQDDPEWARAIANADLAIADSGWAVLFWRLIQREKLTRISGLALFNALLETPEARIPKSVFWVVPSERAKIKALEFGHASNYPITADDCYVAPKYTSRAANRTAREPDFVGQAFLPAESEREQPGMVAQQGRGFEDPKLVSILEERKPKHVIVGIGGGMQDKLGNYLKRSLSYRPAIYCIGAAPGFVTGDQVIIPMWADRFFAGWIFRLLTKPRTLLPRLWSARRLPGMMWRYRENLPPLRRNNVKCGSRNAE